MQPILTQSVYQTTHLLKGTIEGTTEDLKIRGQEIKNLVTSPNEEWKMSANKINNGYNDDAMLQINIDTDQLEPSTEYTIFFRLLKNSYPQQDLNYLKTVIANPGHSGVTNEITVNKETGTFFTTVQTTQTLQDQSSLKLCLYQSQKYSGTSPEAQKVRDLTVTDFMLIKGSYHKWIPFFEDVKGFGPDIALISNNKNIAYNSDREYDIYLTESIGDNTNQKQGLYTTSLIKEINPGTDYVLSFKYNFDSDIFKPGQEFYDKRVYYGLFNEYPRLGLAPGSKVEILPSTTNTNNQEISFKFNSDKYKYFMVYFGYTSLDRLKDRKTKVDKYIIQDLQLEPGTVQTPYVSPAYSYKEYKLPYELRKDDYLMYDCEYNKWVIKHKIIHGVGDETYTTKHLTDIIDPFAYTYKGSTWISIVEKDGILKEGSIEFKYPQDPFYIFTDVRKHWKVLVELSSGEVINSFRYGTVKKVKNSLRFENGFYGDPDRSVILSQITRIIHLD